ncbi:MAG: amidohydrolase family protein [Chloroflexi bacterium]|nr:amidohydrolase family protein [Chloroflexota bacterium]
MAGNGTRTKKSFPVFDCDAHVNDPLEIWTKFVEPGERELVRNSYWRDSNGAILNGRLKAFGGEDSLFYPSYNSIEIAGPGMTKEVKRRLVFSRLNDEQREYLKHKGAFNAKARLRDMDLMGIDQVLVIGTMVNQNYPFIESPEGARAFARAYNNWAADWCTTSPDRLFFAGLIPLQSPEYAVAEIKRLKTLGSPVGLIRPIDAQGQYPNRINPSYDRSPTWDPIYRAFEETGLVVGMHTFPADHAAFLGDANAMYSPGNLVSPTGHGEGVQQGLTSQTLSFIYEATVWLSQVLMSGFLDRYPKIKMAIFESNAMWLPGVLERLDRYYTLYANERRVPAKRMPSQAFYDQCFISFESDEVPCFRQWDRFENVGIWASDCYHHDGADVWSAIRRMNDAEVPEAVQAKMLGSNALKLYGLQPKMYVTEEQPIERPAWFPKDQEVQAFANVQKDPKLAREMMAKMAGAAGAQRSASHGGGY